MNPPVFISSTQKMRENWLEAFPDARLCTALPDRYDRYDNALIFLDITALEQEQKDTWLRHVLATKRKVIVLSAMPEDDEGLQIIKSGAVGYGHSFSAANRLREMSLVVNHGGLWVGSELMKRIMLGLENTANLAKTETPSVKSEKVASTLSQREQSVAQWVAKGATNLEISDILEIKERTVKAHITSIFYKLNVRNRVELALFLNNIPLPPASMGNPSKDPTL